MVALGLMGFSLKWTSAFLKLGLHMLVSQDSGNALENVEVSQFLNQITVLHIRII